MCLSAAAPAEPSELMPVTVIFLSESTAGMAHKSHMLRPIYHLNYFHFHIPMYFLMSQIDLHLRQIACP